MREASLAASRNVYFITMELNFCHVQDSLACHGRTGVGECCFNTWEHINFLFKYIVKMLKNLDTKFNRYISKFYTFGKWFTENRHF
jgi:hypothetical protein